MAPKKKKKAQQAAGKKKENARGGGGGGSSGEGDQEETEYDNMDLEMLQEVVPMLKQQLAKCRLDRNYVQLERDTIQTFYDITKNEVGEIERQILAKDREMEMMEENHRVEISVYLQKVKHLEYEHEDNLRGIETEGEKLAKEENDEHECRSSELDKNKRALGLELSEREWASADEIQSLKQQHSKNLQKMREGFETQIEELQGRLDKRMKQLREDLELRRKAHVHEIEERKNLHINDLINNHEKAFGQMKSYYNEITGDNLKLIRSLKEEVVEMKKKAINNQKLMQDISLENQRLKEPLTLAVAQVADFRSQLKDRQKDRLSLRNAKARFRLFEKQLADLDETHEKLKADFDAVQEERDGLQRTFETAIGEIRERAELKNVELERKLDSMRRAADNASDQVSQIAAAAGLDSAEVERIGEALHATLTQQNQGIKETRYDVVRMTKCYNDALRTYTQKLCDLGIPQTEIDKMGFAPISATATRGPAGLVAQ